METINFLIQATDPDLAISIGGISLFWALAAFGGGMLGTSIGANWSFVLTGATIFLGISLAAATGKTEALYFIAFGPIFGPHICFTGAAAAAAYAGKKGLLGDNRGGRDCSTALGGLGDPGVYLVGGLFGMAGYIVEKLVAMIPYFGTHTDRIAFTLIVLAIVARQLFGNTGFFISWTNPTDEDGQHWLRYQEKPWQLVMIAVAFGLPSAALSLMVGHYISPLGQLEGDFTQVIYTHAQTLPFGISALTLAFYIVGFKIPVTHHITISAGLGAIIYLPIVGENFVVAMLIGTVFAIISSFLCEVAARVMHNHGDTHIDPPASAIWVTNSLIVSTALLFA